MEKVAGGIGMKPGQPAKARELPVEIQGRAGRRR